MDTNKVTEKNWNIQEPGRITDYNKKLPVLELYVCVQSEGSRQGRPTSCVRTTGCTHRCWFGEGGWCDSWYTSIHPEKGVYTFNDIIKMYGSDAARWFILSDSPPDRDIQWSDNGIQGAFKYIQKVWRTCEKIKVYKNNKARSIYWRSRFLGGRFFNR